MFAIQAQGEHGIYADMLCHLCTYICPRDKVEAGVLSCDIKVRAGTQSISAVSVDRPTVPEASMPKPKLFIGQ